MRWLKKTGRDIWSTGCPIPTPGLLPVITTAHFLFLDIGNLSSSLQCSGIFHWITDFVWLAGTAGGGTCNFWLAARLLPTQCQVSPGFVQTNLENLQGDFPHPTYFMPLCTIGLRQCHIALYVLSNFEYLILQTKCCANFSFFDFSDLRVLFLELYHWCTLHIKIVLSKCKV